MRFIKLTLVFLSFSVAELWAAENQPKLDDIFYLPSVQSMEIDEDKNALFVVTEDEMKQWDLFPLRNSLNIPVSSLASDMAIDPFGAMYVVGLNWNSKTLKYLGGSVTRHVFGPDGHEAFPLYFVPKPTLKTFVGIGQFSSVDFDDAGRAFVGSPVSFTVSIYPADFTTFTPGTNLDLFKLRCGASEKISVFDHNGDTFYFSSATEGAVLEFGPVSGRSTKDANNCFRVANVYAERGILPTTNPVRHSVIDLPRKVSKRATGQGVLVLEPNNNRLFLFAIEAVDGEIRISRNLSQELDLSDPRYGGHSSDTAAYNILESNDDGSVILVSGSSRDAIARFSVGEEGLEYEGKVAAGGLVRRIVVGKTGRLAAFVTGASFLGGDQKVTVIENPKMLKSTDTLPSYRDSIQAIQATLNSFGFDAGEADGILGSRTKAAISSYLQASDKSVSSTDQKTIESMIESVFPRGLVEN